MSETCFAVTNFHVSPGLEADAVALQEAAIALILENYPHPKHAAGLVCLASFADLPSGSSYIVEISVRIDPADGEPIIRTESVALFDSAEEMRRAFRDMAAQNHVS